MLSVLAVCCALAQGQAGDQQPTYQPGWPCTGKERAFDSTYAKLAEGSGGHLFLLDKSEVEGMATLGIGDMRHKQTVVRAAGKASSYVDIPIPVDASIESLFVVASLQCMQTIYLYDPERASVQPAAPDGQDAWFRAGRITTISKPKAGQWILRLLGTGPYFVSVQARSELGLGTVALAGQDLTVWLGQPVHEPRIRLVSAAGDPLEILPLEPSRETPGRYEVRLSAEVTEFRVLAEWMDSSGGIVQRMDPRLFEQKR